MLFVTHTTFSVPALMGAIMSVGVATANSILMVTFANDYMGGLEGPPKPPIGDSETARDTRAAPRDGEGPPKLPMACSESARGTRAAPLYCTSRDSLSSPLPSSVTRR